MAANPTLIFGIRCVARLVLGGAFGYAALQKLADPQSFAVDIGNYHLLPYPLTLALAVYLPWLELVCAVAVLSRWRDRGALTVLLALCLFFSLALTSAWMRGLDIRCGCFGSNTEPTSIPIALLRALGFGAIAFALRYRSERGVSSSSEHAHVLASRTPLLK
jgi:putative oxidoreductase